MKVGDCVRVDYDNKWNLAPSYQWTGICTWTDGYKFEFLINNKFEMWTRSDLESAGAEVINESR